VVDCRISIVGCGGGVFFPADFVHVAEVAKQIAGLSTTMLGFGTAIAVLGLAGAPSKELEGGRAERIVYASVVLIVFALGSFVLATVSLEYPQLAAIVCGSGASLLCYALSIGLGIAAECYRRTHHN
jgi:MFS family permease